MTTTLYYVEAIEAAESLMTTCNLTRFWSQRDPITVWLELVAEGTAPPAWDLHVCVVEEACRADIAPFLAHRLGARGHLVVDAPRFDPGIDAAMRVLIRRARMGALGSVVIRFWPGDLGRIEAPSPSCVVTGGVDTNL
mgnify:CR=1 FL=1